MGKIILISEMRKLNIYLVINVSPSLVGLWSGSVCDNVHWDKTVSLVRIIGIRSTLHLSVTQILHCLRL